MRIILLLCFTTNLFAQYDHTSVFPDLEDQALFSALVDNYKPATVQDFDDAKDLLYSEVHLHDDSVRCVYTGLSKYLDLNEDASQFLFGNGGNENINLEHCYPQSKGASSGNARADMHHLFPTRVPVNSARASDPFQEIPDSQTNNWYYKAETRNNPPATSIRDLYSEDMGERFEPREDFKGNVARAYFYFYTMYRSSADGADPDFFEEQKTTLCNWHEQDPVDSLEWVRTYKIAALQDDKVNPFILDCRLARLYCGDSSPSCKTVQTSNLNELEGPILYPNQVVRGGSVFIHDHIKYENLTISIVDMKGKLVSQGPVDSRRLTMNYPTGIYHVLITAEDKRTYSEKIVILD